MGLFKSKEEKEMMLNSTIRVKTKDELIEAMKKGYGTIVPTGPLADKLVAKVKRDRIVSPLSFAAALACLAIPVAGVAATGAFAGACTSLISGIASDYKINMDAGNNYIFVHKKLAAR